MDVHKPKPWHGLREFLREYAIIVVGVLTALGAGQAVEWLHTRAEVHEARAALRLEVADNAGAAQYDLQYSHCLNLAMEAFAAWARGGPKPDARGAGLFIRPGTATWDVVKADAAAHMPLDERLSYSRFYNSLKSLDSIIDVDAAALIRLQGHGAVLDPAEAQRVLGDLDQARIAGALQIQVATGILQRAKAMGVAPGPVSADLRERLTKFCREVGAAPTPD